MCLALSLPIFPIGMKTRFLFRVILLLIVFLGVFLSCAKGVRTRKLLFRNNEFAIYTVDRDKLQTKTPDLLPKSFQHPIEVSEDKLLDILGNIRYKKEASYGNIVSFVFDEREVREFAQDLSDGLKQLKPNEVLLVVSKFNPDKSVVAHYFRTGFYFWAESGSLHILFGEIRKELDFEDEGNYFDWSRIPDIAFDNTPESDFVQQHSSFQFRMVDGFKNKRWLVFDKMNLSKIRFEKRKNPDVNIENQIQSDLKTDYPRSENRSERRVIRDDDSLIGR